MLTVCREWGCPFPYGRAVLSSCRSSIGVSPSGAKSYNSSAAEEDGKGGAEPLRWFQPQVKGLFPFVSVWQHIALCHCTDCSLSSLFLGTACLFLSKINSSVLRDSFSQDPQDGARWKITCPEDPQGTR